MADTNFRGPIGAMGSLEVQGGTSASVEPLDGPSYFYQGATFLDPRGAPFAKDGTAPGRVPAFMSNPSVILVDTIPQAAGTAVLAAVQVATAATPMTLTAAPGTNFSTGAASIAVGVPVIPAGTTTVTTAIALDFGFTTGTTTANSSTINCFDNTWFQQGMWIIVGNVANAGGTQSLITQVQSVSSNGTTITVSPSPATALGVPIGGANLFGSGLLPPAANFGPSNSSATAVSKDLVAGLQRIHNPAEQSARNVSVTASASTGGTAAILVTGLDLWQSLMTELITASGTTTIYGKKGFKYILSAVPQTTQAANFTLGIGDTFSFPLRLDQAQYLEAWAGGTSVGNLIGVTTAVTTPATNTTGDVRGTIQLSGNGAGTPISSQATTNNVNRLFLIVDPPLRSLINTTPLNLTPMFGTAQSIV